MFEFTVGGAWFRWGALDDRSRRLAAASFALAAAAGLLCGIAAKPATRFGLDFTGHEASMAACGIAAAVASAWLWYKFSLRQGELFNRVQNWSLGMGGAWTCGVATAWLILAKASIVPPASVSAIALMFTAATGAFWLYGARRWAL